MRIIKGKFTAVYTSLLYLFWIYICNPGKHFHGSLNILWAIDTRFIMGSNEPLFVRACALALTGELGLNT